MAELKIEVFTSFTCPHCPSAIKATETLLEENPELVDKIEWEEVSTRTAEGARRAQDYGIQSVPTVIVTNSKGERGGYLGPPPRKDYLRMVTELLK